jgi:hypothetical protein
VSERKRRWHGDPQDEHQPDAGDLLVYQSPRGEWYHVVRWATPVRGGGPHDLWLVVERYDLDWSSGMPSIPDEIHALVLDLDCRKFSAVVDNPRRRRHAAG